MAAPRKRIVLYHPQLADHSKGAVSAKDILPLPVLTIAAWPERDGYEIAIVDGCLYSQADAHRRVLEACEGALLFGTTGILSYQVADAFLCAQAVRARHPVLPMVVGGWFASVAPELQLETGLYDAVVLGQGEITFRELVHAVDAGEPLDAVAGLALLREGRTLRTAPRRVVGWDELLDCPWHLLDFEPYREQQLRPGPHQRLANQPRSARALVGMTYFSSFGCPEPCTFCCSPGVTGQRWKAMPAARMLDDLEEVLARYRPDVVLVHDANFGVSEKRAREFAAGKLERGMTFAWYTTLQAFSILRYQAATLDLLAESGLFSANIGAEAGTDEMMRLIGKHTEGDDNVDAALELDRRGIESWMTYIIGYPNETEESMLGTLDQARRIRATCSHAHPAVWPYQPIPGTPMYEQALASGFQPPRTLLEWGDFESYHTEETWPERIPAFVLERRRLFQHFATLSHGHARGRIGWWERRAKRRLERGSYRFARAEAKAFDVYFRLTQGRTARTAGEKAAWLHGDGQAGAEGALGPTSAAADRERPRALGAR